MENAPAFVAEQRDPNALDLDIAAVRRVDVPLLLTKGDESPPWLQHASRTGSASSSRPRAGRTIPGAGHVPHETNPAEYADTDRRVLPPAGAVAA